jgi:hypothetical protein
VASRDYLKHTVSPSEPSNSLLGDEWYNPTTNKLYKRVAVDGITVKYQSIGGSNAPISDFAPKFPLHGDLWWDSNIGQLRVYYVNSDTAQWVDAVNTQGIAGTNGKTVLNGTSDPTTQGVDGDFYINTTTKFIFGPKSAGTWPAGTSLSGSSGVTSVGGTGTVSGLTLTGTVTSTGNLTLGGTLAVTPSNFASQTANTVLAAPNGSAGVPTFRTLVAADLPNTTVTAGAYTSANITVDAQGRITAAANGSGGGGGGASVSISDTTPGSPTAGALWWDSTIGQLRIYYNDGDTSQWVDAVNAQGIPGINGAVSSVGGTGTVSGLTLTGTVTSTGNLTLGGTLAVTPSNFASQTANTVLAAPNGSAGVPTFRALVASDLPNPAQYYRLNTAIVGTNGTTAQNVLGVGVTLAAGTVYEFEAVFNFFKSAGTTSHTFSFGWGGTATFNNIATNVLVVESPNGFITLAGKILNDLTLEAATQTVLTAAMATAFRTVNLRIRGTVSINAGGTFIPQYQLSVAPGGAYTSSVNNYMKITPIGTAGASTSVGTWA